MAVGEGKAGGSILVRGRQINPLQVVRCVQKIAVIDAVGMLIQKNEDAGGLRNRRQVEKLDVSRVVGIESITRHGAGIADHRVHGVAPYPSGPARTALIAAEDVVAGTAVKRR